MRRLSCMLLASILLAAGGDARADFLERMCDDYKISNCWPYPYSYPDRVAAKAAFKAQIAKGWKMQNTLGDHYFKETGELTSAGTMKLRWILTQTPLNYRAVFFVVADDAEVNAIRGRTVQEAARRFVPAGQPIAIMETHTQVEGSPADYIDRVGSRFLQSTPDPRLPSRDGGGSGGGGGGSGGGNSGR